MPDAPALEQVCLPVKSQDGRSGAAQDDSLQFYRMVALLADAASKAMGALHHLMKRQHSDGDDLPLTQEHADAVLAILARALMHLRHGIKFAVRRVRCCCHLTVSHDVFRDNISSLCSMHWCMVRFINGWSQCAVHDLVITLLCNGRQDPTAEAWCHVVLPGLCDMLWLSTSDVLPAAVEHCRGSNNLLSIVQMIIAVRTRLSSVYDPDIHHSSCVAWQSVEAWLCRSAIHRNDARRLWMLCRCWMMGHMNRKMSAALRHCCW